MLGVALLLGTLLHVGASPAAAHAEVLRTAPADGERLVASPSVLVIEFNEPVGVSTDGVRVVDASGMELSLGPPGVTGSRLEQPLPALEDGWYLATWRVVSADGHTVRGAIAFAVGDATGPPPLTPTAATGPGVAVVLRAVADLGLLLVAGSVGAWLVLGVGAARIRRLLIAGGALGAGGAACLVALSFADAGASALSTPAVLAGAVRALALAALVLRAATAPLASSRRGRAAAGLTAALALATMALSGHPSAAPLTALLVLLHLAGASLWLGAAPAVLLVLRDGQVGDEDALRVVRRFSRAATAALALAVGGGTALSLLLTAGLDARPSYLAILAAKVVLVVVAAALGTLARRRLARGRATRSGLRRLFAIDAGLLVIVVALSAALTSGPPREAAASGWDDDLHIGHCSAPTDDGSIANLTLVPARVGDNTIYLDGAGTMLSAQVELRRPDDDGPLVLTLEQSGVGWAGPAAVPVAGPWTATLRLQRDEFLVERISCDFAVTP